MGTKEIMITDPSGKETRKILYNHETFRGVG